MKSSLLCCDADINRPWWLKWSYPKGDDDGFDGSQRCLQGKEYGMLIMELSALVML